MITDINQEHLATSVWLQLSDTFHADLSCLLHEDPEQNFFENISHIQHHRRVSILITYLCLRIYVFIYIIFLRMQTEIKSNLF